MELLNLFEKKILITGASSGIGKHAAITASRHGAEVIITGRNETRLQDTLKQMQGKGHKMIVADISSEKNIDELIEKLTVINGLVHCAGIIHPLPVKFITQKHINEMYSINYHAPVLLTSKLLKAKKIAKGGSIVFLSSISSRFGHIGGALYGGTKAGIDIFAKVTALECAVQKIRANTINAAMVTTELFDKAEQTAGKERMDRHEKQYPLGFGNQDDISNTILFLLSDASRWITGTNITVDGGLTAGDFLSA